MSIELTFGEDTNDDTYERVFRGIEDLTIKVNDDEEHIGMAHLTPKGVVTTFRKGEAWWDTTHSWAWDEIVEIHIL